MARSMLVAGLLGLALTASTQATSVSQQVSSNSVAGAPLFTSETLQLTDEALSSLPSDQRALFEFGSNSSSNLATRSSGGCKTFPGDKSWPSEIIWKLFDRVLGAGSLIKTVPIAAVCYPSETEYDSAKCDEITNNWNNSYLQ